MHGLRPGALATCLMALLGCGDKVKIYQADQIGPYSPQLVSFAAKSGAMAAEIHGDVFGTPTDPEAIAASLRLPGWITKAIVTTRPGPEVASNIRLVLLFNPGFKGPAGNEACVNADALPQGPAGDRLRVAATLCVDGKAVSWLVGEGPAASGTDDAKFRNLMDQVLLNLLPNKPV